jgi:hypothetical protein
MSLIKKIKHFSENQNGNNSKNNINHIDIYKNPIFKDNWMRLFLIVGNMVKETGEKLYGKNTGKIVMIYRLIH